jgi:signal transduction histidine kinase
MRLAVKMFLAFSVSLLVVAAVAAWSFVPISSLVSGYKDIANRMMPALEREVYLRESVRYAGRMEMRYLAFSERDQRSWEVWSERTDKIRKEFDELRDFLTTDLERERLDFAVRAFDDYRAGARRRSQQHATEVARAVDSAEADSLRVVEGAERILEATQFALRQARLAATRHERRTWTMVVIALGVAVLTALGAAGFLAIRMTRALGRVSRATRLLAEGSFREPVPVESDDEIADLARSFNDMAARLREVDGMKEQFYATVSHELRSPLTSVREAAHLLQDGVPGPLNAKQQRLITIIHGSTDRLLRLVNQVLDLSRLSVGALPLERRWFNLQRAAARAVEELRVQADERGISLGYEVGPGAFELFGDEDRITQVVVNLVSNALRFTPAGGNVNVRLTDAGSELEIHVEDTGVGIRSDALPFVFERFRQAHTGRGGTGLGLAIVRAMVEAHGGRAMVESQEGKGSRFTILLPRKGPE